MGARAMLEGEGRWTTHLQDSAFRFPLHRGGDAVCPSKIPIMEAAMALRTEVVSVLGPLPQHEGLAAMVAKEGNALGKPKAQRGAWLPAGVAPAKEAKVLYYVGAHAAYDRPVVALAGLELLRKVGAVNTLGAAEPDEGAVLLLAGQREAAAKQAEAAMKAILKACPGVDTIVCADPTSAWVMKTFWPEVAADKDVAWNVQVKTASEHLLPLAGKALALTSQVAERVHFTEPSTAPDPNALKLLQKVPGLQVGVLPLLPCGAAGAMRLAHPDVADETTSRSLDAAKALGAATLVTSDPMAEAEFAEVSARGKKGVAVQDVLVLVARAAGITLPGEAAPGAPAPAAPAAAPAVAKPAPPKLTPEELEARKKAALEKAAAAKAAKEGKA
jgi:Fe-S oxidoreductase